MKTNLETEKKRDTYPVRVNGKTYHLKFKRVSK